MEAQDPVPSTSDHGLKTIELNDQKAGMGGLDKQMINSIIFNASKGTAYFEHQQKRQESINSKIQHLQAASAALSHQQLQDSTKKIDKQVIKLEQKRDLSQFIVHIDMDAFYAAVELQDQPHLKDKPIGVGALSMLSTSNYVARKFGVRAAMPGFIAKKLCPSLIIIPPNFSKYTAISKQVQNILKQYDAHFSSVGLDEAYLNITPYVESLTLQLQSCPNCLLLENKHCQMCPGHKEEYFDVSNLTDIPALVVQKIRSQICTKTSLTSSAGIAPNAFLAKVCSDLNKPNGQFWLNPVVSIVKSFVKSLAIRKVGGIGPVQGQLLASLGIETCQDLYEKRGALALLFYPSTFQFYLESSLGLGATDIKNSDSGRKSHSIEETFGEMSSPKLLIDKCRQLCEELCEDLKQSSTKGKLVAIKFKTTKFQVFTRNMTLESSTNDPNIVFQTASKLLQIEFAAAQPQPLCLRLLGVKVGQFCEENKDQPTIESIFQKCVSSVFECPVCETFKSTKMAELNDHIDSCLTSSQEAIKTIANGNGKQNFICPSCNIKQTCSDLHQFNQHLDLCLNRETIRILVKEPPVKRPALSSPRKHLKKSKHQTSPSKKINEYFLSNTISK